MIKTILYSTLFPNQIQRHHGVFVANRFENLLKSQQVTSKVIAPVPWFPFRNEVFGKYAKNASVPDFERRGNVDVFHPKYLVIPKIGMNLTPKTLYWSTKHLVKDIIFNGFDFDLIDAHYFYPDGVAAVMLAKALKKPVIITARGTDLNLIPRFKIPRKYILWAANNCDAIITVCQALKDVLVNMGVADQKITVLRNGVDLIKFSPPMDREKIRSKLGITGKTLLSVGHLVERKGHHLVIEAVSKLSDVNLLIAGDGEERANLRACIERFNLSNRVTLLGEINHTQLREYYGAVDALVLASSREGWANVLLESMACGTPVVATKIWGTPEVVRSQESGVLVDERNASSLATGIKKIFEHYPNRNAVRRYAEQFSWDDTTIGQLNLFKQVYG